VTPYYQDETVTLYHGHVADVLPTLAAGSVDCVVTSPPYYGLRDYGVDGQLGLEASPAEYVEAMRDVFAEVRRVLADDGVMWLNLGDSYATPHKGNGGTGEASPLHRDNARLRTGQHHKPHDAALWTFDPEVPLKNLLGVPWRVAFALQDDGWILRNAVIWSKPNAMPESVTDRLSTRYEHVFLFSKSRRYWFDLDPIREPLIYPDAADGTRVFGGANKAADLTTGSSARRTGNTYGGKGHGFDAIRPQTGRYTDLTHSQTSAGGRNPGDHWEIDEVPFEMPAGPEPPRKSSKGDVWTIPTSPFPGAHFATMPRELARRCIAAGCKPGGTVLDPFSGSGTTGVAAASLGRRYVGIDLSAEYLDLSLRTRLAQTAMLDGEAL